MGDEWNSSACVHRLLSVDQMREADRQAIAGGVTGLDLMEQAGAAVAAAAAARCAPGGRVLVLAGPGNNGGDGFVAARLLLDMGRQVAVALLGDRSASQGDAALAAARWTGDVIPLTGAKLDDADLIIDAIFGAGLARDVSGSLSALIDRINLSALPVIAVDIPSGVDGNSGAVRGTAIKATETVTFFRKKPGHLLMPGRALCGHVTVADIGIPSRVLSVTGFTACQNAPAIWRDALPRLDDDGHKFHRGHVLVVAGGLEGVGAPRLSARAALRVGAGLVTIATEPDALLAHASRAPDALMVRTCADAESLTQLLAVPRRNVCVIGPALGLQQAAREKVHAVLRSEAACVLDADALTLMAGRLPAIARAAKRKPVVLTPHEGEFARLFNDFSGGVGNVNPDAPPNDLNSESKLVRAKAAAQMANAVVVLKGADTVIAAPDGRAVINDNAPPWLATAGAGDVLTGLIGGLLAQGMPAFNAACAAVWLHGATASALKRGMIADDLIDHLAFFED